MGCITATAWRLGGIKADASRIGGISVTASLVCTINKNLYLRVRPEETQWIDIDTTLEYQIQSNTHWNIE